MATIATEAAAMSVKAGKIAIQACAYLEEVRRRSRDDHIQAKAMPARPRKKARIESTIDDEADDKCDCPPGQCDCKPFAESPSESADSEFPRYLYSASHGGPVGVLWGSSIPPNEIEEVD